jgi:hypothetical protein
MNSYVIKGHNAVNRGQRYTTRDLQLRAAAGKKDTSEGHSLQISMGTASDAVDTLFQEQDANILPA